MPSLPTHERIGDLFSDLSAFLAKHQGSVFVVKYGGNAMTDPALKKAFAQDIVLLKALGIKVVVVHGGGPQIEVALNRLELQGKFIQGLRVTDEATLQVAQWVLTGQVQQEIVVEINEAGGRAVGLCGVDGLLFQGTKLQIPDGNHPGEYVDFGLVGEIKNVNTEVVTTLLNAGSTPVISPIARGDNQQNLNINADTIASSLAKALKAEQLLMLTNISGVLDGSGQLVAQLNPQEIALMIEDGTISGGMIPKIQGAIDASSSGIEKVYILDGRVKHAISLGLLAGLSCGTLITQ